MYATYPLSHEDVKNNDMCLHSHCLSYSEKH